MNFFRRVTSLRRDTCETTKANIKSLLKPQNHDWLLIGNNGYKYKTIVINMFLTWNHKPKRKTMVIIAIFKSCFKTICRKIHYIQIHHTLIITQANSILRCIIMQFFAYCYVYRVEQIHFNILVPLLGNWRVRDWGS